MFLTGLESSWVYDYVLIIRFLDVVYLGSGFWAYFVDGRDVSGPSDIP